jgi:hypothetical protein
MRPILFVLLLGVGMPVDEQNPRSSAPGADAKKNAEPSHTAKSKGTFTISKATTYVTQPVDKDGYIDYATALNERLRQGITPDNNANTLLVKALGPHPEGETLAPEYYRLLGIQPPPEKGEYFVPVRRYPNRRPKSDESDEELFAQLHAATQRPWSAKQYPDLAGWLRANEKPLALVREATKREHFYSPVVPRRPAKAFTRLVDADQSSVQACRGLANALVVRAMLRTHPGAVDEAWQDLLACHRLGRLVGRGGMLDALVGIAIDSMASTADVAFLDYTHADKTRIDACLADLRKLPPLPDIATAVDVHARFVHLDGIMMLARGIVQEQRWALLANVLPAPIDWDPALRNTNGWYDRFGDAMREKSRSVRNRKLEDIEKELEELTDAAKTEPRLEAELKELNRKNANPLEQLRTRTRVAKIAGRTIGDIMLRLFVPSARRLHNASDRARQIQDNVIMAFILARYERDHGRYPRDLNALLPNYLTKVPEDVFSGKPLIYQPTANGYLFYSVGANGTDEHGRGYEDEPAGDDLSVRMPVLGLRR